MGLRHEDFAVLGQFCAKVVTYKFHHPDRKRFCKSIKLENIDLFGQISDLIFQSISFVIFVSRPIKRKMQRVKKVQPIK